MNRLFRGRWARFAQSVAVILIGASVMTGCKTDWVYCDNGPMQVWDHTKVTGMRTFMGRAKLEFSHDDAQGGRWKIDAVHYTIVDFNQHKKSGSWNVAGFAIGVAGLVAGAVVTLLAKDTKSVGLSVIGSTITAAGLFAAWKSLEAGSGLDDSSEDYMSARYIRVYSNGTKIYENFVDGRDGNNEHWRNFGAKGDSALHSYIAKPTGLYVPDNTKSKVTVQLWADSRGIDGDTQDYRDQSKCTVTIPLPKAR